MDESSAFVAGGDAWHGHPLQRLAGRDRVFVFRRESTAGVWAE